MLRIGLLLTGTLGAACSVQVRPGYYEDDRRAAETAMAVFHARLGQGQFEEIYSDSSEALRATAPKTDLLAGMRDTHQRFGRYLSARIRGAACFPGQVRFVVHADYEKGPATEMFLWHVQDGTAKLALLEISPGHTDVPTVESNCPVGK
jgi:hypothetical protein